jgi:hypothetical protein
MNSPVKVDLVTLIEKQNEWYCPPILIPFKGGTLTDIVQYIGNNCPVILKGLSHYLSNRFADVTDKTRNELVERIRLASSKAGFSIVLNQWRAGRKTL